MSRTRFAQLMMGSVLLMSPALAVAPQQKIDVYVNGSYIGEGLMQNGRSYAPVAALAKSVGFSASFEDGKVELVGTPGDPNFSPPPPVTKPNPKIFRSDLEGIWVLVPTSWDENLTYTPPSLEAPSRAEVIRWLENSTASKGLEDKIKPGDQIGIPYVVISMFRDGDLFIHSSQIIVETPVSDEDSSSRRLVDVWRNGNYGVFGKAKVSEFSSTVGGLLDKLKEAINDGNKATTQSHLSER